MGFRLSPRDTLTQGWAKWEPNLQCSYQRLTPLPLHHGCPQLWLQILNVQNDQIKYKKKVGVFQKPLWFFKLTSLQEGCADSRLLKVTNDRTQNAQFWKDQTCVHYKWFVFPEYPLSDIYFDENPSSHVTILEWSISYSQKKVKERNGEGRNRKRGMKVFQKYKRNQLSGFKGEGKKIIIHALRLQMCTQCRRVIIGLPLISLKTNTAITHLLPSNSNAGLIIRPWNAQEVKKRENSERQTDDESSWWRGREQTQVCHHWSWKADAQTQGQHRHQEGPNVCSEAEPNTNRRRNGVALTS